ncbi:class I SAM-dependent methyltransferase [bacterium]|nr:class I SAM-dependent methyltransferase [candidate division CSSED10-310 bacterium]
MEYDPRVRQEALAHIEAFGLAPTHRRIVEMAGKDRYVLDLGCATGYLAKALKANGCSVTGIEKDSEAAVAARSSCRLVLTGDAGDPEILRQAGGGYDVIICADILEHLPDPWLILKTLRGMLAPRGELLVSIPNIAYWRMRLCLLAGNFDYTDTGLLDSTHLRFFTVRTFKRMAAACGYRVTGFVINDAGLPGFPHPVDWDRLPGCMRKMAEWFPNLCVFHAIYRLKKAEND